MGGTFGTATTTETADVKRDDLPKAGKGLHGVISLHGIYPGMLESGIPIESGWERKILASIQENLEVQTTAVYNEEAHLISLETDIPGLPGPAVEIIEPDVILHLSREGILRSIDFLSFSLRPGTLKPLTPQTACAEGALVLAETTRGRALKAPEKTTSIFDPLNRTLCIQFGREQSTSYARVGDNLLVGLDANMHIDCLFVDKILDLRTYNTRKAHRK